jgi:hypothetical protein
MANSEQSSSGRRPDWPVRLATGAGAGVGAAIALLLRPVLGWSRPDGFLQGVIGFAILTGVGTVLGQLMGGLLFRPSSGELPDHPPHA